VLITKDLMVSARGVIVEGIETTDGHVFTQMGRCGDAEFPAARRSAWQMADTPHGSNGIL
jgi:hypothetical protein